jgi:hypothetical protein
LAYALLSRGWKALKEATRKKREETQERRAVRRGAPERPAVPKVHKDCRENLGGVKAWREERLPPCLGGLLS